MEIIVQRGMQSDHFNFTQFLSCAYQSTLHDPWFGICDPHEQLKEKKKKKEKFAIHSTTL